MDHEQAILALGGGIDLRPGQLAGLRRRVDEGDRLTAILRLAQVGDGRHPGALQVDAGDVGEDGGPGGEAVGAVELGRADALALGVPRHVLGLEVEPATRVGAVVEHRVRVARPRQQAAALVERVAAARGVGRGRDESERQHHGARENDEGPAHGSVPPRGSRGVRSVHAYDENRRYHRKLRPRAAFRGMARPPGDVSPHASHAHSTGSGHVRHAGFSSPPAPSPRARRGRRPGSGSSPTWWRRRRRGAAPRRPGRRRRAGRRASSSCRSCPGG